MMPNKRGKPNKKCCWEEYADGEELAQTAQGTENEDPSYWLIQNSWGSGWGAGGYVKLAIEDGVGVSGMNAHFYQVYVDPSTYDDTNENSDDTPEPTGKCAVEESCAGAEFHGCSCAADADCRGERVCSSGNVCEGEHGCE